jgi:hypothetical protein
MLPIRRFKFYVIEEGAKRPLSRVTRAPSLGFLIFCFHNLHKKGGKGVRKEGKPTVAIVDKNGVKILDDGVIVKICPKILC